MIPPKLPPNVIVCGDDHYTMPEIFDTGNSPDSLQWLAHVKAWGWPFLAFDDPRKVVK